MDRKIKYAAIAVLMGAAPAAAQQSVQPYVVNGGGGTSPITRCQVGTVASGTCPMPVTISGSGSVVTLSPATKVSSSALAANQIIVTGAHVLTSFNVSADSTLSGGAWWVMIYDATTAPADGAVTPAKCYAIPSGATSISGNFTSPVSFTTGIVIGVSTTGCFTKTASTHAFISGDYQ